MVLTIYDIVKAHGRTITVNTFNSPKGGPPGGELKVKTEEGEARLSRYFSGDSVGQGTEFIIQLPIY